MVTTPRAATHPQHLSSILEMILHIDDLKPWSHRACDLAATKKIGIRGEVAEVTVRFYKGRSKVGDQSPYTISCGQSFELAQKTSRD